MKGLSCNKVLTLNSILIAQMTEIFFSLKMSFLPGFLSFSSMISPEKRPLVVSQLQQMKNVMAQLVAQQVDHTEFSCLKALVLFRPGKERVSSILYRFLINSSARMTASLCETRVNPFIVC